MKTRLSPYALNKIRSTIDLLFNKAKIRVLGPQSVDKRVSGYDYKEPLSLPGIFMSASLDEYTKPDENTLKTILTGAGNFIDSYREATKAQVIKRVDAFLRQAETSGVDTDLETVLGGQLADVWKKTTTDLHRLIDTEAQNCKSMGALDGIIRVNAAHDIEDPVIYKVVVRDQHLCETCKRLHMLEDGITPRLWYLSELHYAYGKKDDKTPTLGPQHPHCRCSVVTMMPGFGFNSEGYVAFKGLNHDAITEQRQEHGVLKYEDHDCGDVLEKADAEDLIKSIPHSEYGYWLSPTGEMHVVPHYQHEAVGADILKKLGTPVEKLEHVHPKMMSHHGYARIVNNGSNLNVQVGKPITDAQVLKLSALTRMRGHGSVYVSNYFGGDGYYQNENWARIRDDVNSGFEPQQDPAPVVSRKKLRKGSFQSRHPYDPATDTSDEERFHISNWQDYAHVEDRESIPRLEGEGRVRALNKLHAKTQVRKSPVTGEREFLLHRATGSGDDQTPVTSWTSDKSIAESFARGGRVLVSDWIPESRIHHVLDQVGYVNDMGTARIHGNTPKPGVSVPHPTNPDAIPRAIGKPGYREREVLVSKSEPLEKYTPEGLKTFEEGKGKWIENGEKYHPEARLATSDGGDSFFKPPSDPTEAVLYQRKVKSRIQSHPHLQKGVHPDLENAFKTAPITINFPDHVLKKLHRSGRFQNLGKTKDGMGCTSETTRKGYEHTVLGIPRQRPWTKRPIYGALNYGHETEGLGHEGGAASYGRCWVTLKPHVKSRSSFTFSDSFEVGPEDVFTAQHLDKLAHHWTVMEPHFSERMTKFYEKKRDPRIGKATAGYPYVEAQIHGGVSLRDDVEAIHVPLLFDKEKRHAIDLGKKYGVPVVQHYWKGSPEDEVREKTTKVLYDPTLGKSETDEDLQKSIKTHEWDEKVGKLGWGVSLENKPGQTRDRTHVQYHNHLLPKPHFWGRQQSEDKAVSDPDYYLRQLGLKRAGKGDSWLTDWLNQNHGPRLGVQFGEGDWVPNANTATPTGQALMNQYRQAGLYPRQDQERTLRGQQQRLDQHQGKNTWINPGEEVHEHVPVESLEISKPYHAFDFAKKHGYEQKLSASDQQVPHAEAMKIGDKYAVTDETAEQAEAAKAAGYSHVPVRILQ